MKNTRLKARLMDLKASAECDPFSGMELAAVKVEIKETEKKIKRNDAARAKRRAYESLGLKRVTGALGGVYYE